VAALLCAPFYVATVGNTYGFIDKGEMAALNRIVRDQLERASLSVVLNIAEAGGPPVASGEPRLHRPAGCRRPASGDAPIGQPPGRGPRPLNRPGIPGGSNP
jgi:hypothetical protein